MVSSTALTVEEYLDSLPADRREIISTVRDVIVRNLPEGYREIMDYGMIGYGIPLERFPATYNGHSLCYAALASQKNHCSLYLMSAYGATEREGWLRDAFTRAGKKLDMGKSCVRFKSLDELPLPAIGEFIGSVPVETFIAFYERTRAETKTGQRAAKRAGAKAKRAVKKTAVKKTAAKKAAAKKTAKKKAAKKAR
jgi:hypothetical protein